MDMGNALSTLFISIDLYYTYLNLFNYQAQDESSSSDHDVRVNYEEGTVTKLQLTPKLIITAQA